MSIDAIIAKCDSTKADYLAKAESGTRAELHELHDAHMKAQFALSEAIIEGAKLCPGCGQKPHGMRQDFTIGKEVVNGFEIGCLTAGCLDIDPDAPLRSRRQALGFDRENAVRKWNDEKYLPPKAR